jgi:hypothetical protein
MLLAFTESLSRVHELEEGHISTARSDWSTPATCSAVAIASAQPTAALVPANVHYLLDTFVPNLYTNHFVIQCCCDTHSYSC